MKKLTYNDLYQIADFNKIVMNYLKMIRIRDASVRLMLYTCIALVPISCGTRKVSTEITENKAAQDKSVKEQANTQTTTTSKGSDTQKSQNDKVKESVKTTTTKYDPSTGNKTEETTTEQKKSTDNSTSNRNKTFDYTQYYLVNMERTIDTHRNVTSYEKKKTTSSERYGFGLIGLIVGTVLGIWLWPKVKRLFAFWF